MIINYGKYFKDNFKLQLHFEHWYVNLEKRENIWFITNYFNPSVNSLESIFNMKIFDSKVILIYDFKNQYFIYNREIFFKKRTLTIWKLFVKKKKYNRLGLKMLKVVSEHLGNPRFVNFSV